MLKHTVAEMIAPQKQNYTQHTAQFSFTQVDPIPWIW